MDTQARQVMQGKRILLFKGMRLDAGYEDAAAVDLSQEGQVPARFFPIAFRPALEAQAPTLRKSIQQQPRAAEIANVICLCGARRSEKLSKVG